MRMSMEELKDAANTERLINQYKDPEGNDPMTQPIPAWLLDKLAADSGRVEVLMNQLIEAKQENAAANEIIAQLRIEMARKDDRIRMMGNVITRQRQTIEFYEGMPVTNFFSSPDAGKVVNVSDVQVQRRRTRKPLGHAE